MTNFKSGQNSYIIIPWKIFLPTVFLVSMLFIQLNKIEPHYFVDEIFHIPQTINYCNGNFTWDPKITTLPGLYLITSFILAPFHLCTTFWIRSTSLIGTFINLLLITPITKKLNQEKKKEKNNENWVLLVSSYSIAFTPPLFFFFFLYYTDVFSLTFVLAMYLMHLKRKFSAAAFFGFLSMLVRQTNVIWIFFLAAVYCLDELHEKSKVLFSVKRRNGNEITNYFEQILKFVLLEARENAVKLCRTLAGICRGIWGYTSCGFLFAAFVLFNGSIVVGDHKAHKPTLHILQIYYFSAFAFAFAWPYMLPRWKNLCDNCWKHWPSTFLFLLVSSMIFRWYTMVHPFVLADNRHYVFYAWNRFLKFEALRYSLVPVFAFTLYTFWKCVSFMRIPMRVLYVFCVIVALVPQLLLEPRYFLIPYVLFRLHFRQLQKWQVLAEAASVLGGNFLQFWIFARKTFVWENMEHAQRIGW